MGMKSSEAPYRSYRNRTFQVQLQDECIISYYDGVIVMLSLSIMQGQ